MERPNILLIVIDSARADHFSCYGYGEVTTPNIDGIAAEGVRFDAAYAESTWTLPQAFTLLTGLAPREQCSGAHRELPADIPMLSEALRRAGYSTFAASANIFFHPRTGLQRGFDRYFVLPEILGSAKPFARSLGRGLGWCDAGGQACTSRFIGALDELSSPWFALLWYNDVHLPYVARQPFTTKFSHRPLSWLRRIVLRRRLRRPLNLTVTASQEDLADIAALYDGALAYEDMLIGQIREALEKRGLGDETIVIITADHGEMLGERRLLGHAQSADIYRPLVRVPLIIRAPGRLRPQTYTESLVQSADIPRTLASLTGTSDALAPTAAEHADLFAAANDPGRPHTLSERDQFSDSSIARAQRRNPLFDFQPTLCHMTAVVKNGWRLIHRSDGRHELYDHQDDPGEENDLIGVYPERAAELAEIVTDWQQRARPHPDIEYQQATIDPRVEKRLRDLGYF